MKLSGERGIYLRCAGTSTLCLKHLLAKGETRAFSLKHLLAKGGTRTLSLKRSSGEREV
jgi:hypothetical protein